MNSHFVVGVIIAIVVVVIIAIVVVVVVTASSPPGSYQNESGSMADTQTVTGKGGSDSHTFVNLSCKSSDLCTSLCHGKLVEGSSQGWGVERLHIPLLTPV